MKFQLKKSLKGQKGFTLVELSVVVLVAGLMLTAVMKGQSMLETARAQKFSNEIKNVEALIGTYETATGRLPGDCNGDGLIGTNLGILSGSLVPNASLLYTTTATDQTTRAELYSFDDAAPVANATTASKTSSCAPSGSTDVVAASEANVNVWVNDLRNRNIIGVNTVPRLFAKHIGEDMMYVGTWRDSLTGEDFNAMTFANVPADMAQRVMQSINGSTAKTDFGPIRVFAATAGVPSGAYVSDAFAGTTKGSTVNLVYFFRNQPRSAS